jgi:FAD/FMN-containing dehydrogenase
VSRFELLRSSGERVVCSPERNADLFRATIGGLGLTGLILWAELRLRRAPSSAIAMERVRFASLDEFFALSAEDQDYEYTAAWIDCLAVRGQLGRGLYVRGNHITDKSGRAGRNRPDGRLGGLLRVPCDAPGALLSPLTVSAFNALYYRSQISPRVRRVVPYGRFFFPLDGVRDWNRLYGRHGFLQHQCVVPEDGGGDGVRAILERVGRRRQASFLAVIKRFGDLPSPGMLSFPRSGVTLALDFPYRGSRTLKMLEELDELVVEAGGAVYPAKDARMSAESFRRYFSLWQSFAEHVDPKFSSGFWRRVNAVEDSSGLRG